MKRFSRRALIMLVLTILAGLYLVRLAFAAGFETEWEEDEEEELQSGMIGQLESWWQARAWPDHTFISDKWWAAWEHAQAMRNTDGSARRINPNARVDAVYGNWLSIGPNSGIGGRIITLTVHPANTNTIYAGSASGGIWRSVNGGSTWSHMPVNMPVLGVSSILISSADPNIMYAGTGEVYRVDSSNFGYNVWKARGTYGIGVIKSINGGITWDTCLYRSSSMLFGIQKLRFSPSTDNTVFACATDGLYRSVNDGATWTNIAPGKIYVSDVVINTANPDQMLITVGNLTNTNKGIYRTTNGTSANPTWTKINAGLPGAFGGFGRFAYISGNTVFASLSNGAGDELYQSANFGQTWTQLNNSSFTDFQLWCTNAIEVNPTNANVLIVGGVNLFRYNVSTETLTGIGGGVHDDFHDIVYDPSNANTFYVACDGGVYKTTNGGNSFTEMNNGLGATQFYASLGVSTTNPNLFLGGLQDNGVVRYNGTTWATMGWVGGDGTTCAIQPGNNNTMIACRDARGIYRSTNGGGGGGQVANYWGFVGDSRTGFVAPLAYSRSSTNIVYCATDVLHKSTNSGQTWSGNALGATPPYPASTPNNFIEAMHKTAIALAVSPTNPNKVYVSTSPFAQYDNNGNNLYVTGSPNVLRTLTGAVPFTSIKTNLPNRFVMDFAISATNDDSVFVVLGGYGTSHVYVTGNGGASWTNRGNGLPDVPFNAILIDQVDPNIIYAGCDLGVYVSNDRGLNWFDFNGGFSDATQVFDLQAAADNRIVAATHGKGIWVSNPAHTFALPVSILDFYGVHRNGRNELTWKVEKESVLRYELERKIDNGSFVKLSDIPARNSSSLSTYNYSDNISGLSGNNYYYRLKIIDMGGAAQYSGLVLLKVSSRSNLEVLGNPVTAASTIRLTLSSNQRVIFKLYDAKGSLVHMSAKDALAGVNRYPVSIFGNLPAGHYTLEATTNTDRFTKRIIVR
jgi:hypothetical protein